MKLYIINLNKQRIFILSGIFLVIIAFSFWIGNIFGQSMTNQVADNIDTKIKTDDEINSILSIDDKTIVDTKNKKKSTNQQIDLALVSFQKYSTINFTALCQIL